MMGPRPNPKSAKPLCCRPCRKPRRDGCAAAAVAAKLVHHAKRQGRFGPHHGQINAMLLRPLAQFNDIGDGQILEFFGVRRAPIAGGDMDLLNFGRTRQFPSQGVFATARADDQDIHSSALW